MAAQKPTSTLPVVSDEIIKDAKALAVKSKMMGRLRWNSMLNSVGRMATFFAGILLTTGTALMGIALKGASDAGNMSFGKALATMGGDSVGLAFMGLAAVATVVAVSTDYVASRIWQGNNVDNLEFNAKRTADHLVKKLKENNLCLTNEYPQNCRNDGQTWVVASAHNQQAKHSLHK